MQPPSDAQLLIDGKPNPKDWLSIKLTCNTLCKHYNNQKLWQTGIRKHNLLDAYIVEHSESSRSEFPQKKLKVIFYE